MNRFQRLLPAALLASASLWAGGATAWESNTFADFVKGRFQGISLTRDGRLTLAPSLETLASTGEAGIWSVLAAPDGTLYFSTGHRGRVYQVKPGGQPAVLWAAQQPEVFALALDGQGRLYAATSPDGRIYRIQNGKATEFFNPSSKYVWSLAIGPDGAVYVATGDQGRIWRVSPDGHGEVWYETGQTHVTALAFDAQGRLLAGTEPNGILYRIEAKDRAFVLYDSSLPEIRSIVPAADGSLYVAALGGALAQKQAQAASAAAAAQQSQPSVTTSITVTSDAYMQGGVEIKPKPEAAKPPSAAPETAPAPVAVDVTGIEKAAIYRIAPDNTVETIWSSKEENVFDLALQDGQPVFSTDERGRIYRLARDLKSTLLLETHESETTRLLPTAKGIVAATSNQAKLYRLSTDPIAKGSYESPVHDAGNVARWGRLDWRADGPQGLVAFRTRSGNSQRPDRTWSQWSDPVSDPQKALISSPNARYIQWQAEFQRGDGQGPILDSVSLSYQPQNGRPVVRSVQVTPQWVASAAKTAATTAPQAPIAYSITVTDSGDAGTATSPGTPTQNINRSGVPQLFIAWQADDPEGDKLVYSLWYRAEDENNWKLLKSEITDNSYMQETEIFADGRYYFRVLASDQPANSPATAKEGELVSQPVLIDQTPPLVTMGEPRTNASQIEIDVDATDAQSPLRRAEYSYDGSAWKLLDAADGIADSKQERFIVRFNAMSGEHSVVVRVFDSAGNPGLARTVLR